MKIRGSIYFLGESVADFKIFIKHKEELQDAESIKIKKEIIDFGLKKITNVVVYQIYEIAGDISNEEIQKISQELLVDPVAQNFYINATQEHQGWEVEIYYKQGVTDAVADTVKIGMEDMNLKKDISIKTGKKYFIEGELTLEDVKKISLKILSNPLVQEYSIINAN